MTLQLKASIAYLFILLPCFALSQSVRHDYCIVGAGPGGLQMGYFLKKSGRDYIIFEKGSSPGTFFQSYPRHRKLISINKVATGRLNKEFNLRFDWNSLLSDDDTLMFPKYTNEYFPDANIMVKYLKDYQEKFNLFVQFDSDIRNISRQSGFNNSRFCMQDQRGQEYSCKIVVVATGTSKPNTPSFDGSEYVTLYQNISTNPDDYAGKNVLILGRGNSAFETADAIYRKSNFVHMLGRSRPRLSWNTHYVGDVRAINSDLLDSYQLKSLDGLLEAPVEYLKLRKNNGRLSVLGVDPHVRQSSDWTVFPLRDGYDVIISCLGFSYDDKELFSESMKPLRGLGRKNRYPHIKSSYESSNVPDLYFAGSVTHSLDYRKSSGGFIHGFRFTVQALHNLLEYKFHDRKWPYVHLPTTQLLNCLIRRINEAVGMYEMFGELGDIVIFRNGGRDFDYLSDAPLRLLPQLNITTGHQPESGLLVVILDYGEDFSGPLKDTFREDRATADVTNAHRSNFLHPIIYFYDDLPTERDFAQKSANAPLPKSKHVHHMLEDFLVNWASENVHILPLRRYIENILQNDLRHYDGKFCLRNSLTYSSLPFNCKQSTF